MDVDDEEDTPLSLLKPLATVPSKPAVVKPPATKVPFKRSVMVARGKVGGDKGKSRSKPLSYKARKELGEAAYDLEKSPGSDYEDERVGAKRKPTESGRKGNKTKRVKSAAVIEMSDEESDVPTIPKPAAKPSVPKSGPLKRRSNFKKFLPSATMSCLNQIKDQGKWTEKEKAEYDVWFQKVLANHPELKPLKVPRANQTAAIVLLGKTLSPPEGLKKSSVPCDYCKDFCPHRCFVLDEGTSCLICNFFRHTKCERDGKPVSF